MKDYNLYQGKCKVDGCENAVCLSLYSDKCFIHTEGSKFYKHLRIRWRNFKMIFYRVITATQSIGYEFPWWMGLAKTDYIVCKFHLAIFPINWIVRFGIWFRWTIIFGRNVSKYERYFYQIETDFVRKLVVSMVKRTFKDNYDLFLHYDKDPKIWIDIVNQYFERNVLKEIDEILKEEVVK